MTSMDEAGHIARCKEGVLSFGWRGSPGEWTVWDSEHRGWVSGERLHVTEVHTMSMTMLSLDPNKIFDDDDGVQHFITAIVYHGSL